MSAYTALHFAAVRGATEAIEALCAAGADPNVTDRHGATPLELALREGQAEAVASLKQALLFKAAHRGDVATLARGLREGADVHGPPDSDGYTLLHVAAESGRNEAMALLLEAGADPNARASDGFTPLHSAAARGHDEAVAALLAGGAAPDAGDEHQITALHFAAFEGYGDAIAALLGAGADPNARTTFGFSPLMFAADGGQGAAVATLLAAGARVEGMAHEGLQGTSLRR